MSARKKLFVQIFIATLCLWVLFLALVPTLLSRGVLNYWIQKKVKGTFSYEKAHLSWFKPQSLSKIQYHHPEKGIDLKIDSLSTKATLLSLLLQPRNFKETHIQGLEGSLTFTKETLQSHDLEESPKREPKEPQKSSESPPFMVLSIPFIGKVHLDQSSFIFHSSEYDPILFKEIQLTCTLDSKGEPFFCNLACETSQKELSGSVFLNLELGGFDKESQLILTPFDHDLFFLAPKGYLQLNAELTNLPSMGLDHIAHLYHPQLKGILPSLLGDSLNLGSQINMIKGKSKLHIKAKAPNMNLSFSGSVLHNELLLDEASICNLKITPAFIQALTSSWNLSAPLSISEDGEASIHLDRLSLPLDLKNFNLNNLSCNAHFSLGALDFSRNSDLKNFKIQEIKGVIDTFDIGENVTFHLKALAEEQLNPILLKLDGQVSKLVHLQDSKGMDQLQGSCQLELKDVPSRFLTHLSDQKTILNEVFGPLASLNLKINGSFSKATLALSLNSSRLDWKEALFELTAQKKLELIKSSSLTYHLNPSLAKLVLNPKFTLLHPFEVQGKLKKLAFVLSRNVQEVEDLQIHFLLKPFETSFENSKPIHIEDTKLYISKNEEGKIETKAYFTSHLPLELKETPFGNSFDFSLIFKEFSTKKNIPVLGMIKGKSFSSEFEGLIDSQLNLHLTKDLSLECPPCRFEFKNRVVQTFAPIHLLLEPLSLKLADLHLKELQLKGIFKTPEIALLKDQNTHSLKDVSLPFEFQGVPQTLDFKFIANEISFKGLLTEIRSFDHFDFQLQGKLKRAPFDLLNIFSQKTVDYTSLLGDFFDFNFEAKGQKRMRLNTEVSYHLASPNIESKGRLTFDDEIFLNEPIITQWTLTPDHLKSLPAFLNRDFYNFELLQPASFKITLNRLHKKGSPLKAFPEVFEGEIYAEKLVTKQGEFHQLEGHFETPNIHEILNSELHVHTLYKDHPPGELSIKADIIEPLDTSFENFNGLIHCNLHYFPTELLYACASSFSFDFSHLSSALGPIFNLRATLKALKSEGPLKVEIQSNHLKTSALLNLEKDHLTLAKDLKLELRLTPELAKNYLSKIHPFLSSAVASETPTSLLVDHKNCYIPLVPFDLTKLDIPSATLSVEQILLKEEPYLDQLLALFHTQVPPKPKALFTPCHFSLKKGVLHLEPNHFQLMGRYHFSLQGDWDLLEPSNFFLLELSSSSLKKAFSLSQLPEDSIFQIPLKEDKGQIKMDFKNVEARLSELNRLNDSFPTDPALDPFSSEKEDHSEILESQKNEILKNFLKEMKKKLLG